MPKDMDHSHRHRHRDDQHSSRHDAVSSGNHHHRVRAIAPTEDNEELIVIFKEGITKVIDLNNFIARRPHFHALSKDQVVRSGKVVDEGLGVCWDDDLCLPSDVLWDEGVKINTPFDGLLAISEAAYIWDVNRRAISEEITDGTIQVGLEAVNFGKQWVLTRNAMLRTHKKPKRD